MKIPLTDYIRSSCELAKEKMFFGLWKVTNEYPCAGCHAEENCQAKKEVEHKNSIQRPRYQPHAETNAEMAARLGISKRQASKMRNQQTYTFMGIKRS